MATKPIALAGDELGRMIYDNGYSTRWSPEKDNYELVKVVAGTMLIEALLLENPTLYGRFRFTLAHELAHWILHKKLLVGTGMAAATHGTDNCSDNSVEWQANYLIAIRVFAKAVKVLIVVAFRAVKLI